MAENRTFPEVTFVETDTEEIKTALVQGIRSDHGPEIISG